MLARSTGAFVRVTLAWSIATGGSAPAQATSVVPAVAAHLPGNAALAMPLRWSHGTLQVFVDAALLPPALMGQPITGVRLRRPTLPGDGPYLPLQRTLTVRGGFQPALPAQMQGNLVQNRPANVQVLFGPAVVATAAAPAPGPATTVGPDLVSIPFALPLVVAPGSLFLEFEAGDAPLQFAADHWVDGVWFTGGFDQGLVAAVGDGSCTTRPEPTRLSWTAAFGPAAGVTASLEVRGAPPTAGSAVGLAMVWAGLDPENRPPGAGFVGYGATLAVIDPGLAGCHQWAPLDVAWAGPTDAAGRFVSAVTIPAQVPPGLRLGLQAAWLDPSRAVLPLSFSNGLVLVCRTAGVDNRCSTMFFPGGATTSPWPAFVGQMPVLLLEH